MSSSALGGAWHRMPNQANGYSTKLSVRCSAGWPICRSRPNRPRRRRFRRESPWPCPSASVKRIFGVSDCEVDDLGVGDGEMDLAAVPFAGGGEVDEDLVLRVQPDGLPDEIGRNRSGGSPRRIADRCPRACTRPSAPDPRRPNRPACSRCRVRECRRGGWFGWSRGRASRPRCCRYRPWTAGGTASVPAGPPPTMPTRVLRTSGLRTIDLLCQGMADRESADRAGCFSGRRISGWIPWADGRCGRLRSRSPASARPAPGRG